MPAIHQPSGPDYVVAATMISGPVAALPGLLPNFEMFDSNGELIVEAIVKLGHLLPPDQSDGFVADVLAYVEDCKRTGNHSAVRMQETILHSALESFKMGTDQD